MNYYLLSIDGENSDSINIRFIDDILMMFHTPTSLVFDGDEGDEVEINKTFKKINIINSQYIRYDYVNKCYTTSKYNYQPLSIEIESKYFDFGHYENYESQRIMLLMSDLDGLMPKINPKYITTFNSAYAIVNKNGLMYQYLPIQFKNNLEIRVAALVNNTNIITKMINVNIDEYKSVIHKHPYVIYRSDTPKEFMKELIKYVKMIHPNFPLKERFISLC